MKRKHDTTGDQVATWAGSILGSDIAPDQDIFLRRKKGPPIKTTGAVLLAICASAVNQAEREEDRSDVMRSGRLPPKHKRIKRHKPVTRNHKARKRAKR